MKAIFSILISILLLNCSSSKLKEIYINQIERVDYTGSVLLVVAHQDDEVFILSRLKKHLEAKDSIFVVWTTASYHKGDKYKIKRIEESKKMMRRLNISEDHTYFLMYPDGFSHNHVIDLYDDLSQIIKNISPNIIYISAFEGGHIDHDVINAVVDKIIVDIKIKPMIYEFPEYSNFETPFFLPFKMRSYPKSINTFKRALTIDEYEFVLNSWKLYNSQYFPLHYYIKLFPGEKKTFGIEYFRVKPDYNYFERPSYGIAYEKFLTVNFDDFKTAIRKLYKEKYRKGIY